MRFLIDTANIEDIRYITAHFPIDGVTTNPSLLSKEKTDPVARLHEIRSVIGEDRELHVQVTTSDYEDMIAEAEAIVAEFGKNTYIKVPVSDVGLKVTRELTQRGIGVTETAIFTEGEALLAARAGARYVAPYVNRLDNILADGIGVVSRIREIFDFHEIETEILAASFKNIQQVLNAAASGSHVATISADLFRLLASHPMTDAAISGFAGDWKKQYGEKTLLAMLQK